MSTPLPIPEDTKKRQRDASDPRVSAWVSANAGSGKTYVLSRRVIRLLLAGNDPATILCLTFTKAAANEMANRVFEELAKWVLLDDAELSEVLLSLGEPRPNARALIRARQLFAHALETPGGLKVQTIHAFCERLLQQFPFEANVPGHFEVADDETALSLLTTAREQVLADAILQPESDVGQAFEKLIAIADDDTLLGAISEVLRKRDVFMNSINTRENGLANHQIMLADALGIAADATLENLADQVMQGSLGGFGLERLKSLYIYGRASAVQKDVDVATRIDKVFEAASPADRLVAWLGVFATAGKPRKSGAFLSKALKEDMPEIFADIENVLPEGFEEVRAQHNAITTLSNTEALFVLTRHIISKYLDEKNRRGLLDYDDLISKTGRLLSNADAALWVQYKLDRGLAHILVDEAQDTSPAQWRVVEALSDAFFHETAPDQIRHSQGPRTIFAVGDEKQSIYSFQGAAPDAFEEQRRAFEAKARRAQLDWRSVKLNLSFRSVNDVLSAVDAVFSGAEMANNVSKAGVDPHQAYRASAPGEVVMWPLQEEQKAEKPEDWRLPVDAPASALEQVAARIASDIADMIHQGQTLADGRPVRAGDFLILLKKRGQVMGLVNRALKRVGVAVAGMDRLALNDHIAVRDLRCLGAFMLMPDDDLSLASVLKSPFFGFDDDDLLRLAPQRAGSLWHALHASGESRDRLAYEQLASWLGRVDFETPYRFFARILSADGGRAKLLARLGSEADDLIEEFLNQALEYETLGNAFGLQGFLQWLGTRDRQIKREMDTARDEVRVMTVHGAKGLEAPIVYLVDDGSKLFHSRLQPKIYAHGGDRGDILFWGAGAKADQSELQQKLLERKQQEDRAEYHRLLYVAMTRAEDRLVLCGKVGAEDNWHPLVAAALKGGLQEVFGVDGEVDHYLWRKSTRMPLKAAPPEESAEPGITLPDWVHSAPMAAASITQHISPSSLHAPASKTTNSEPVAWEQEFAVMTGGEANLALLRGTAVHTLLQYLPGLPADQQRDAASVYLAKDFDHGLAEEIRTEVSSVLSKPELAFIFDQTARAELSVAGQLQGVDGAFAITGKIDRLCKTPGGLLIVDFKTNRNVPTVIDEFQQTYINQLAAYRALIEEAYPDLEVTAALLWTREARLDYLDAGRLNEAKTALLQTASS